jgi:hypothetical protein
MGVLDHVIMCRRDYLVAERMIQRERIDRC